MSLTGGALHVGTWEPHLRSTQAGRHPETQSPEPTVPALNPHARLGRELDPRGRDAGGGVWGGWISESSALGGLEEGLLRKDRNSSGLLA